MTSTTIFVSNRFISAGDVGDTVNGIPFPRFSNGCPGPCIREAFRVSRRWKRPPPTFCVFFSPQKEQLDHPRCLELDGSLKGGKARGPSLDAMKITGRRERVYPSCTLNRKQSVTCGFHDCVCLMLLVVASRVCAESLARGKKWIISVRPSIVLLS